MSIWWRWGGSNPLPLECHFMLQAGTHKRIPKKERRQAHFWHGLSPYFLYEKRPFIMYSLRRLHGQIFRYRPRLTRKSPKNRWIPSSARVRPGCAREREKPETGCVCEIPSGRISATVRMRLWDRFPWNMDAFVRQRSTADIIPNSDAKTKSGTSKSVCACGDFAHPVSYLPKSFYTNSASHFLNASKRQNCQWQKQLVWAWKMCEFYLQIK